ncbi:hypothetical protein PHMEG_00024399 [Phytophthora megakarya]|uniref:C2H2-type domain-containing protein n=1 Tax=Phytophthora megakarya TaxID=4795 RepID=A0A225VEL0_9STRA|nr:hypothetical protein PHMEG_00024399 [Phytophthora megakarya]
MTVPPSEELTRVEENVLKIVQHVNSDWVIRAGSWKFLVSEKGGHAGMAYATRNVRMHCYLDVFGKVYLPNHTQLYLWTEHLCSNCYKVLDLARVRNRHQAACTVYTCRPCEKRFGTKEGLKSHRARKHKYLKL